MKRTAMIGGTASVVVVTVLFIFILAGTYYTFIAPDLLQDEPVDIPENFEPFSDRTVRTEVALQTTDTAVSGALNQALYAIRIDHDGETFSLPASIRRWAYCHDKRREIQFCETYPPRDKISRAIRQGMDEILTVQDTSNRPYQFSVTYGDDQIFSAGGGGGGSSFAFMKPLPGGEHVRITIIFDSGSLSTGVVPE